MRKYLIITTAGTAALFVAVGSAQLGALGGSGEMIGADRDAIRQMQTAERYRVPVVNRSGREVLALFDDHERYGGHSPEFLVGETLLPEAGRFIDFSGPDRECLRHLYIVVRGREDEAHPLSAGPEDVCSTAGILIGEIVIPEALSGPTS